MNNKSSDVTTSLAVDLSNQTELLVVYVADSVSVMTELSQAEQQLHSRLGQETCLYHI